MKCRFALLLSFVFSLAFSTLASASEQEQYFRKIAYDRAYEAGIQAIPAAFNWEGISEVSLYAANKWAHDFAVPLNHKQLNVLENAMLVEHNYRLTAEVNQAWNRCALEYRRRVAKEEAEKAFAELRKEHEY